MRRLITYGLSIETILLSQTLQTFVTHTTQNCWENAFDKNDIIVKPDPNLTKYLARKLAETRFTISGLEALFIEFAIKKRLSENLAKMVWSRIGTILESNVGLSTDEHDIDDQIKINVNDLLSSNKDILNIISEFRKLCRDLISSNVGIFTTNKNYAIGVMGELFAYLYALDIAKYDCVHHKLVPDNSTTFRHGMDLIGVKFDETDERKDQVFFTEAKATTTNILSQRNEIIKWFNQRFTTKANTMIDQAKRSWQKEYPEIFLRANRALSRVQVNLSEMDNFTTVCVGSVLIDDSNNPTKSELLGFKNIQFEHKKIVMIKTSSLINLSQGVFAQACMI